jgi:hypothetical protein
VGDSDRALFLALLRGGQGAWFGLAQSVPDDQVLLERCLNPTQLSSSKGQTLAPDLFFGFGKTLDGISEIMATGL